MSNERTELEEDSEIVNPYISKLYEKYGPDWGDGEDFLCWKRIEFSPEEREVKRYRIKIHTYSSFGEGYWQNDGSELFPEDSVVLCLLCELHRYGTDYVEVIDTFYNYSIVYKSAFFFSGKWEVL